MAFNFEQTVNRRGTGSYKWDSVPEDVLPLWVADMDYPVAPAIQKAVQTRAAHPIFGYTKVMDSYYDAIISWYHRRHGWDIDRKWILYTQSVVPALSCTLKALTLPGEKVMTFMPAYNCFFSSIANQGCQLDEVPLVRESDSYVIDFDLLEEHCADEKATVLLLCNPHNPTGRVWTPAELEKIGEICERHHVIVVSDEIHCEIIMPGYTFTPFAAVNERNQSIAVTLQSPSKSFNTAGLQIANVITSRDDWRRRIDRMINVYEVCDVNPFGPVALEAAYNESEDWLKELNEHIASNYQYLKDFFREELPMAEVVRMEGTYLAWIDIMAFELTSDEAAEACLRDGKVKICSGTLYGRRTGQGYLRINLACPRETLKQGLIRVARVLSQYCDEPENEGCPA